MPEFYLGVDGGQSSTTALIADDSGAVLGRGFGGPCNHVKGEAARARFLEAMGDCLRQACQEAGLSMEVEFAAVCLGFSGGYEDKEDYSREVIRGAQWKLTHDAEIGLAGATAGHPGTMVIAGTGSMAFGKDTLGRTARAGGWGYIFGDEGGALYLVRQGLRAALQQEEGWGQPTLLSRLFLKNTGAGSINEILHRFYVTPRSEVALYARLLDEAADEGDVAALEVFADAGCRLAWYVEAAYRQLFRPRETVRISYIGGAFRSTHLVRTYSERIRELLDSEVTAPAMSPAAGALIEAAKLSGSFSAAFAAALISSAKAPK